LLRFHELFLLAVFAAVVIAITPNRERFFAEQARTCVSRNGLPDTEEIFLEGCVPLL
jgi:hypothetical protein